MESSLLILKGKIEFANFAYEKISGYTKDELMGSNIDMVKSGTHTDTFL